MTSAPEQPEHHDTPTRARAPRCVVLLRPDEAVPAALVAGLARRQVRTVLVDDPPSVMLQLALEPTAALIVVEPERQPQLPALLEAVGQYYCSTRLWRFDPAVAGRDQPVLRRLTAPATAQHSEPGSKQHSEPARESARESAASPRPPQTASEPAPVGGAGHPSSNRSNRPQRTEHQRPGTDGTVAPDPSLLTAEELAMLLGPPEEGEPPTPR